MANQSTNFEVQALFNHFDQNNNGFILKEEFESAFGRAASEKSFSVGIEDLIKPLATRVREWKLNIPDLFAKCDKNQNNRLSAEELCTMFRLEKYELQQDEVAILKQYFMDKHKTHDIGLTDFMTLLRTEFVRAFDEGEAKESLKAIKSSL
jgi:Ca2+-binding EF-hand superfamily protein